MNLPMLGATDAPLMLENIPALQDEVRALAAERGAVILAHNYQLPEIQDVADYVGDSLGLSQQAAERRRGADRLLRRAFHGRDGVDPVPGQARADPRPGRRLLAGRLDHRASSCATGRRRTRARSSSCTSTRPPRSRRETDYCCTSANAVQVVEHIYREHGEDTEILFGPDMFLGAYVEKTLGRPMHVWDGECHVHAGIKPQDITDVRAAHPTADFLIHPECGCSTSVMEYVAAGDVDSEGVHMLSTGGMLGYARGLAAHGGGATAIVATETGMLHPLRQAAPDVEFIAANEAAHCRFMKMITLPKLRDALRDGVHEVKVPAEIAEPARVPIERMVAISRPWRADRGRAPRPREPPAATHAGARTPAACSSGRRRGRPSPGRPTATCLVDALEPRHAVEGRRDEHDDVLGPALALRRAPALVGHARAAEQGRLDRPAVGDPAQVALELQPVHGMA